MLKTSIIFFFFATACLITAGTVHAQMDMDGLVTVTVGAGDTLNIDGNLTIGADGEIDNQGRIEVAKDWSNSGTFNKRTGIVVLDDGEGTNQRISGGNIFNNLEIKNSLGVEILAGGGKQRVWNTLTLTTGEFNVNGDSLILLSDVTGTARVAQVTGGSMRGNMTMRRYISGNDAWRILSPPVFGAALSDWNGEIFMSCIVGSPHVFPHFTSVYTYREDSLGPKANGYSADDTPGPAGVALTDVLSTGRGYYIWVGDDGVGTVTLTVDITDSLTSGTQNIAVTYTNDPATNDSEDGWNLIGNPFPSDIYWDSVSFSSPSVTPFCYLYDPSIDDYRSFDQLSGRTIPSHQGFWIKIDSTSNDGTDSVIVEEKDKAPDGKNFFKTSGAANRLKLYLTGNGYGSATEIHFKEGATAGYDSRYDAYKLLRSNSSAPNLSSLADNGFDLSVNSISDTALFFSIPVKVQWTYPGYNTGKEYTCILSVEEMPYIPVSLCMRDNATGEYFAVEKGASYTFTIADTTTVPRFTLVGNAVDCSTPVSDFVEDPVAPVTIFRKEEGIFALFRYSELTTVELSMVNILGQTIYQRSFYVKNELVLLDIPPHAAGLYSIRIEDGQSLHSKTIISGNYNK